MGNHFVRFLRTSVSSESSTHPYELNDLDEVRKDGTRWIVLDRHALMETVARGAWYRVKPRARQGAASRTVSRSSAAIGPPVATSGALVVWDLDGGSTFDEPFTPTEDALQGLGWAKMDWVSYEATLDARLRKEGVIE